MPKKRKRYIVVGAGTSGCILARRLIDHGYDVILIERGACTSSVPADIKAVSWPFARENSDISFIEDSEPIISLLSRVISIPQGKSLGGTSNINAMIWSAGSPEVFDRFWPDGWKSNDIKTHLASVRALLEIQPVEASGNMQRILAEAKRGLPLTSSSRRTDLDPLIFDLSGVKDRYCATFAGDERILVGKLISDILISDRPDQGTLIVLQHTLVHSLHIDEDLKEASAVHLNISALDLASHILTNSRDPITTVHSFIDEVRAQTQAQDQQGEIVSRGASIALSPSDKGEIILCAGVYESPRILARSNISFLASVSGTTTNSIPPINELRLQDHTVLPLIFLGNWWSGSNGSCSNGVHGWINLDEYGAIIDEENEALVPKYQLLLVDGRIAIGLLPGLLIPKFAGTTFYCKSIRPMVVWLLKGLLSLSLVSWIVSLTFGFLICEVQPNRSASSKGAEANTTNEDESLSQAYLTSLAGIRLRYPMSKHDITMRDAAMHLARRTLYSVDKSHLWYTEIFPGPLLPLLGVDLFVRLFSTSYYHQCGSCSIGSVVDKELRVNGISRLRVADASVIPVISSSPIAAICMAIAEKAYVLLTHRNE